MKKRILPVVIGLFLVLLGFKQFETDSLVKTKALIETEALNGTVVLELFTSQGCSSCPPADLLLQEVEELYPENVMALSYHVDYWNYIGWADPFSKPEFTLKQRAYNSKLRSKSNYTPQLVINGNEHVVGSDRRKILEKIASYRALKDSNPVQIKGGRVGDKLIFNYDVKGNLTNKELRFLLVLNERTTVIKRGENRNRTLTNANIVVAENEMKLKVGLGTASMAIPDIVDKSDAIALFVIVQDEDFSITGGAKLTTLD